MDQNIQTVIDLVNNNVHLSPEEKAALVNKLKETDKKISITEFKLDRTEKVKRTTAILLEETIEELEHKRKTVEAQNKELEIEASLERVRTVAMSMMTADDLLSICQTMFHELKKSGFDELRNTMIDIHYDEKEYLLNYDYAEHTGKTINPYVYSSHHVIDNLTTHARQSNGAFTEMVYAGNSLEEWRAFRKKSGEADDPRLDHIEALYYYFYSIGTGSIGISMFKAANPEQLNVLKRFRNVFDLAYKRYVDITNAEAQARESKIEAALEKVRSRSLAMHHSDELEQVAGSLFDRLVELGITLDGAAIFLFDKEKRNIRLWIATKHLSAPAHIDLPYDKELENNEIIVDLWNAIEKGTHLFNKSYSGKTKNDYFRYVSKYNESKIPESIRQIQLESESWTAYLIAEKNSIIGFDSWSGAIAVKDEHYQILIRFARVFDQAYTRFLDLQKAEAQSREGQIQLALERVRAKTMAMHKSDELREVVALLFEQVKSLGFDAFMCSISLVDKSTGGYQEIVSSHAQVILPHIYNVPYIDDPFFNRFMAGFEEGVSYKVFELGGVDKTELDKKYFTLTDFRFLPEETKQMMLNTQQCSLCCAYMKHGCITAIGDNELSHDQALILQRFSKVFEQTYIRFLDLQKSEAQAREGQIQLALERVRARTMAMQKSDELSETAVLLFHQLMSLELNVKGCGFNIWEKDEKVCTSWMSGPDGELSPPFALPLTVDPLFIRYYESRQNGEDFWVYETNKAELTNRYKYLGTLPVLGEAITKEMEEGKKIPDFVVDHVVNFSKGNLIFITYERCPDEWEIFKRFGKVFEQTYTRFLDLQKAEAQAREAKIEAALEKVRSRSLAMHKSDELSAIARAISEQLHNLGLELEDGLVIMLFNEGSHDQLHWPVSEGVDTDMMYKVPHIDHPVLNEVYRAREAGVKFIERHFSKDIKDDFLKKIFSISDYKTIPVEYQNKNFSGSGYHYSFAMEKYTGVLLQSYNRKKYPEEHNDILRRFARVFEQAYVRFLDLQKAEAQARESQIQLALERARAQGMMMQHSSELDDTLRVFHEQVLQLGVPSAFSFLWLPDEDKDRHIFWAVWAESNSTVFKSKAINYSLDRNEPATAQCLVDWKSHEPVVAYRVPPEGVAGYFAAWSELIAGVEQLKPEYFSTGLYYVEAFIKYGCFGVMVKNELPEDEKKILARFAVEFEQTYTRFLDLKKAEAQAREGQIQLALERVRARTMAMHSSIELSEAAVLLFEQLSQLGANLWICGFCICDSNSEVVEKWMSPPDGKIMEPAYVPYTLDLFEQHAYETWKNGGKIYHDHQEGSELQKSHQEILSHPSMHQARAHLIEKGITPPASIDRYAAPYKNGYLMIVTTQRFDETEIFVRFAKVFEQTYTRFLDLQKAEAQAREAQTEAALEKVRSRSLAMHRSNELKDVVEVVFEKLNELNFSMTDGAAIIITFIKDSKDHIQWIADTIRAFASSFRVPYSEYSLSTDIINSKETGVDFFSRLYSFEEKNTYFKWLFENAVDYKTLPDEIKQLLLQSRDYGMSIAFEKNSAILIPTNTGQLVSEDEKTILKRFAKVFEQAYTRFLDLQKAEAQAREAKIEASLERVRSKAMAMHKSDDLQMAVATVFDELDKLDLEMSRCGIGILHKIKRTADVWTTHQSESGKTVQLYGDESMDIHPLLQGAFNAWVNGQTEFSYILQGDDLVEYYKSLGDTNYRLTKSQLILSDEQVEKQFYYVATFHGGGLFAFRDNDFPEEAKTVMKRFANVFDLTYKRFLDIQNAEARAREAQIELSLERVRAKTMAMHNSADVGETAAVMEDELKKLGIETIRCGIGIMHEPGNMEIWTIRNTEDNQSAIVIGWMDMHIHPLLQGAFESWRNKNESYSYELTGDDLINYFKAINNYPGYPIRYDMDTLPQLIHHNEFTFSEGILFAFSLEQLKEEQRKIFKRFAAVFGQTYRRYLDLKKAEAQAREAQVETALERVRSVAMSMMKSDDLLTICKSVFTQLQILGFKDLRAAQIYIRNDEEEKFINYDYSDATGPDIVQVNYNSHPYTRKIYDVIRTAGDGLVNNSIEKKELEEWKTYLYDTLGQKPEKGLETADELHYYLYSFGIGAFGICTFKIISKEDLEILKRFRNVFNLSYQRYSDIALAEAQAREAQVEAALERVRSRTLAMQKSDELAETAAVLFQQLIALGMEPNRLYIGIVNSDTRDMEMWATDEDGTGVGKKFTFNARDNDSVKKLYDGWAEKIKSVTVDMQGAELESYISYLQQLQIPLSHALTQKRRVQSVAYFDKGFIGMASPEEQSESSIHLLERFAAVFNLTFTRFSDLKIAEAHALQAEQDLIEIKAARKKAEDTLTELQATQKQLIQSEKMASLGELTAGIAHEIQNPLNFVNNFSEVNSELIEEMKQEINKGDLEEAKFIMEDIRQNLEKINHHGRRAEAIVKGMLQHSQKSTGEKIPTDINALADEYLRLAYHGIRAKDKSFNAKLETDFDTQIGKVNTIPQDIGRVVLNILTNAFYAVNEKKSLRQAQGEKYEPTILIRTRKVNDMVEIIINDNGNGIPKSIVDKIFQPFFTTKPTGQGTGLGLSLAYDIVKAHGGELKVETKENEGTEFIIRLSPG
ncbi:MAG: ATP-binding protein [Chitinophagaceae bacterium]